METLPNELKLKVFDELDAETVFNLLQCPELHKFIAVMLDISCFDELEDTYGDLLRICAIGEQVKTLLLGVSEIQTETGLLILPLQCLESKETFDDMSKVHLVLATPSTTSEINSFFMNNEGAFGVSKHYGSSAIVKELKRLGRIRVVCKGLEDWTTFNVHVDPKNVFLPDLKSMTFFKGGGPESESKFEFTKLTDLRLISADRESINLFDFNKIPLVDLFLGGVLNQEVTLRNIEFSYLETLSLQCVSNVYNLDLPSLRSFHLTQFSGQAEKVCLKSIKAPQLEQLAIENNGEKELEIIDFHCNALERVCFSSRVRSNDSSYGDYTFLNKAKEIITTSSLNLSNLTLESLVTLQITLNENVSVTDKPLLNLKKLKIIAEEQQSVTMLPKFDAPDLKVLKVWMNTEAFSIHGLADAYSGVRSLTLEDYNHPNEWKKCGGSLKNFKNLEYLKLEGLELELNIKDELEIPQTLRILELIDCKCVGDIFNPLVTNPEAIETLVIRNDFEIPNCLKITQNLVNLVNLKIGGFEKVDIECDLENLLFLEVHSPKRINSGRLDKLHTLSYVCEREDEIEESFLSINPNHARELIDPYDGIDGLVDD